MSADKNCKQAKRERGQQKLMDKEENMRSKDYLSTLTSGLNLKDFKFALIGIGPGLV